MSVQAFLLWQKFAASVLLGSLATAVSLHEFRVLPLVSSFCLNAQASGWNLPVEVLQNLRSLF